MHGREMLRGCMGETTFKRGTDNGRKILGIKTEGVLISSAVLLSRIKNIFLNNFLSLFIVQNQEYIPE
jgi:hypothetical protein